MKKEVLAIAFLVFFGTGAFGAVPDCTVNPANSTGIIDCGVQELDPTNDSVVLGEYTSLADFVDNDDPSVGFPLVIDLGHSLRFRVYLKSILEVPAQDNYLSCALWQDQPGPPRLKSNPFYRSTSAGGTKLTLQAGGEGWAQIDLQASDLAKLRNPDGGHVSCTVYNQAAKYISRSSKSGLTVNASGPEIEIGYVQPLDWGADRIIGETREITHTITNHEAQELGPFTLQTSLFAATPLKSGDLQKPCVFEEGGDSIPAGETKTVICDYTVSFLAGQTSFYALATFRVNGRFNQVQVNEAYTVDPARAYAITRLSPFSIYESLGSLLSVDYRLDRETGTENRDLYFVAQVKEDGGSYGEAVSSWEYNSGDEPEDKRQELTGYSLEDALSPGKKFIRLMVFDGTLPDPLPNPNRNILTATFSQNLFDWAETTFYVPRMLQMEESAYLPADTAFPLTKGAVILGIRNLSDVSSVPGNPTVDYSVTFEGDPNAITDMDIGCDGIEHANWVDQTFHFTQILEEENFADPQYGGMAPALNEKICFQINELGTYKFIIQSLRDVGGTALDEGALYEELLVVAAGRSITKLTAESPVEIGTASDIYIEINEDLIPTVEIIDQVTNLVVEDITPDPGTAKKTHNLKWTPTEKGNYRVRATIDFPCSICKKTALIIVTEPMAQPVPEMGTMAVALVALGVVLIIGFKKIS